MKIGDGSLKMEINKTNMWHYVEYLFKLLFGFMIIIALDVMLKKVDPEVGDFWFYFTLICYNGYCYLEYRLTDKLK
jgi:hypothetical protein